MSPAETYNSRPDQYADLWQHFNTLRNISGISTHIAATFENFNHPIFRDSNIKLDPAYGGITYLENGDILFAGSVKIDSMVLITGLNGAAYVARLQPTTTIETKEITDIIGHTFGQGEKNLTAHFFGACPEEGLNIVKLRRDYISKIWMPFLKHGTDAPTLRVSTHWNPVTDMPIWLAVKIVAGRSPELFIGPWK